LAAGCNSLDRNYLRDGVGTEVSSADIVAVTTLQDIYFGEICRQAGLAVRPTPDGALFCDEVSMPTGAWTTIVQAGMNDIDRRCDSYLAWLDDRRRWREPFLKQLHSTAAATAAIMGLTGVGATPIAIVGAAFGFAQETFVNLSGRLITEINQSTVQALVLTRQNNYRGGLGNRLIPDRPTALYALRSYLRICMPMTIETEINVTMTGVERNGGIAPAPMITPSTVASAVRAATIANVRETPITPFKPLPKENTAKLFFTQVQDSLCVATRSGTLDPATEAAIRNFLIGAQELGASAPAAVTMTTRIRTLLNRATELVPSCQQLGFMGAFEVGRYGMGTAAERRAAIVSLQGALRAQLSIAATDLSSGELDLRTRQAVAKFRTDKGLKPALGGQVDAELLARIRD
jgi:hypothetical protein